MKEHEIRPEALLKRYVKLSEEDAKSCFSQSQWDSLNCVACGNQEPVFQFSKSDFAYAKCELCRTLYQTPRPALSAFERFYRDSESSRYWAEVFFPAVAEVRREKIFRPRVEGVFDMVQKHGSPIERLVDIGAGYGIFLDEWRSNFPETELVAIEPSPSLADECRAKGLRVIESIAENVTELDGFADLVVCFEVLEHVHDPLAFVNDLKRMVRPGGYLFISTLCIDGFDLQILWDQSSQISPPHHINFFSVKGFDELFMRAGLTDVEIKTPGRLDVDIVRNAVNGNPSLLEGNRFLTRLLEDEEGAKSFQKFLSENKLSSHAWIMGRVPS